MTWLRIQDGALFNIDRLLHIEIKGMEIVAYLDHTRLHTVLYKTSSVNDLMKVYEELCAAIADYDVNKMVG